MAKLNKERIVRAAEKHIRGGKLDAAVKEYEKWIADNPNDRNIVHKAADLYARIGEKDEAIEKYMQLAESYRADGFAVKTIATYKMILRLDPRNARTLEGLADLQVAQGFLVEAKSQYQTLVELYSKSGQKRRVAEVFKKLAELDPTDLRIRYRFAEYLDREGQIGEAVTEYIGIADACIDMGLLAEAMKILEKAIHVDASDRALRLKLAQVSVLQGDHPKAVQLLSEILEKHPDDTEIMTRLGEAYVGAGRLDEAEKVLGRVTDLEPDNPEHAGRMADLAIGRGDYGKALERLGPSVGAYVSRGEGDKAEALLQKILNREPLHIETLVKLAELHTVLKNDHARISAYDRLCEAYTERGNYEKAVNVAEQLVALEPESSQHKDRLRFLKSHLCGVESEVPGTEPDVDSGDARVTLDETPIPNLSAEEEEYISEKLTEAQVWARYGLIDRAIDQLKNLAQSFRFHTGVRETLIEIYRDQELHSEASRELAELAEVYRRLGREDEARRILQEDAVTDSCRDPAEDQPPVVFIEAEDLPEDDCEIVGDIPAEEPEVVDEVFPWTDEGEETSAAPSSSALQEVDDYIAVGLYEDAKESLRELLERYPEDPVLLAKMEALGEEAPASMPIVPHEMLDTGRGFRGGGVASDAPLSDPGLDAVFRAFKKGVEKQVGTDDYDTRYNLGIAYKEMGLVDEAIAEFQIAAKDEARLWECCSMLGLCFVEKGMHDIAIKWFEKGLALPGRDEEAYCGLRYDLARAYEAVRDMARALALYRDIYRVDARFRDVSERLRALQAVM